MDSMVMHAISKPWSQFFNVDHWIENRGLPEYKAAVNQLAILLIIL